MALIVLSALAAPSAGSAAPNLIVNGDAESGAPAGSGYDAVTIPGWQIDGLPTVVRYGQHTDGYTGTDGVARGANPAGTFPTASTPGPSSRGAQLFVGGSVGTSTLTQTASLSSAAVAIDGGNVTFTLDGWLGGNGANMSDAQVTVTFLNSTGAQLRSATIGPVTAADRLLTTQLLDRTTTGAVPRGARSAEIKLTLTDATAPNVFLANTYNNAYADDLSLRLSATLPAPPAPAPPASRVGRLDHVFMVFMENEGFNDIVGASTAPYLNSLIAHHGLATDYHGVEHPSDDNYVAFFGASTHGIDANCAPGCAVGARNLADQIEAAHKTWRFYQETMPSPCYLGGYGPNGAAGQYYEPDLLPWSYFTDLLDNMPRCKAHDFPLPQMAKDLAQTRTSANYVWWEPDDCDDMESCGIAAGDTWLSHTVPTILNSPAFKRQRSAIFITFDEDFNNKSFNQDNQGNRVPTIVIASPRSGMLRGPVRDPTYTTHYSLTRTIELALRLRPMTLNDRYATPLNGFWPAVPVLSGLRITRSHGAIVVHYRDSAASLTTLSVFRGHGTPVSFTHRDRRGANSVRLPRPIRIRLSGRITCRASAANAAGVTGAPVSVRFTVKR